MKTDILIIYTINLLIVIQNTRSVPLDPNCNVNFRAGSLQAHNYYRQKHGSPDLVEDESLDKIAQNYATYLSEQEKPFLGHNDNLSYDMGENLAYYYRSDPDPTKSCTALGRIISKLWYDEITVHNFTLNTFQYNSGHFTQLIWKSTKKVGFGVGINKDGIIFAVANYSPAGNVMRLFSKNVFPMKSK